MSINLYTVVCRYYTLNGIFEVDLYELFKRLHIKPFKNTIYGDIWDIDALLHRQVYNGDAVRYDIKMVRRDIELDEKTNKFYSVHPPYSILYDCVYDRKDVERMNDQLIRIRLNMSDKDFYNVYGGTCI